MRIASVAKLRALSVIACLLAGGALLGLLPGPSASIGQEQPSDLPANWQTLQASEFANLAEKYLLSATPQAGSRAQLIQHAWKTFLASDEVATKLDDTTLDRMLGIVNARNPESLKLLTEGLDANQQAQLLQRWNGLKTRSFNAAVAKLGEATSIEDLLIQVRQMRSGDNPFALFSPEVGKQVGGWVGRHADELNSASTNDLLEVLDLMKSRGAGPMAVVYQTWITPPASGTYSFSQLRHGALEGAMTISVGGQAIYDSSNAGENRFGSAPVQLTAGRHVQLEAVYTYDPKALIQVGKLPRDAGSGRWPIVPVVGVLWKQGESDYELIPDAAITTDAAGKTPGVKVAHYSEPARATLLFEAAGQSLGEINASRLIASDQLISQQLLTDVLLKRDVIEMLEPPLKPVPEPEVATDPTQPKLPRFVYQPTVLTLVEALSPQQRETLITGWLDQPQLLAKITPNQLAQLWKQVYLLPGSVPVDLLVAWSDARSDWEETLSVEERWEQMAPKGASLDTACNASAKQIAATMEGAYAERVDELLTQMIDEEGHPRLSLVKIALAAASNNYRLKDVIDVIDAQIEEAKDDGDRKATWLIADAYKIEAVEGAAPHPEAVKRLEEVVLVTESLAIKQQAGLEILRRNSDNNSAIMQSVQELRSTLPQRTSSGATTTEPSIDQASSAITRSAYSAALQRRLEKARLRGQASEVQKYEQRLQK